MTKLREFSEIHGPFSDLLSILVDEHWRGRVFHDERMQLQAEATAHALAWVLGQDNPQFLALMDHVDRRLRELGKDRRVRTQGASE
jgi:hypothetical protein